MPVRRLGVHEKLNSQLKTGQLTQTDQRDTYGRSWFERDLKDYLVLNPATGRNAIH